MARSIQAKGTAKEAAICAAAVGNQRLLRQDGRVPEDIVERPVWRRFRPKYLTFAAAHVRRGGHAAIVRETHLEVLLTVNGAGRITELGHWALLSIEQKRWRRIKDGPAKGLAKARIRSTYRESVLDWCDRDSVHEGPIRRMVLDCTKCAACCHDANVVLDDTDLSRFRDAGRSELAGKSYIRRSNGLVTLRFAESGKCQHLRKDKRCGIYAIRPDNCRAFVVGSEACLAAREDTLKVRDNE